MIIGVGIDIVEIERIRRIIEHYGDKFIERIFTVSERKYCHNKMDYAGCYAGKFAGKEAFLKALGTGLARNIRWKEIEIITEKSGKPQIIVKGNVLRLIEQLNIIRIYISISHSKENAMAMVILEN
ncbi:holo-[acyl-carrier-protein] synthase [bacterium]|nr:MAG: holo-[acyl-carrier-protein] synthase [bacterium]